MTTPGPGRTVVTFGHERIRPPSDIVIFVFFSMSLESRSLNYLDVVPITVGNRELYISTESIEALDVLKIMGISYPRIRECAHT
jgi:hypothetical protein